MLKKLFLNLISGLVPLKGLYSVFEGNGKVIKSKLIGNYVYIYIYIYACIHIYIYVIPRGDLGIFLIFFFLQLSVSLPDDFSFTNF